jgi:tetratricopeptide (TPR) repeat protein
MRRHVAKAALILWTAGCAASCRPAVVHVPVTPENAISANAAASDGDLAFYRKDYYAALMKYLKAGEYNPNSEHIFNKIGIAYSRLKFYDKAIVALNQAIALNSQYSYAYNNLGSVYFANSNKKKAEKLFRKAISLKNDEASFHINLGTLLFERKQFDKGLQELRRGISLNPNILKQSAGDSLVASTSDRNTPEKSYFMARFHAALGNVEGAVENLQRALAEGFTNLEAIRTEKDFDPIRQDEKFVAFMKYATQFIKS